MYTLPAGLFYGKPNPMRPRIMSVWDNFFKYQNLDLTFGIISPLAIIEMLTTIYDRVDSTYSKFKYIPSNISSIIVQLKNGAIDYQELNPPDKKQVIKLARIVNSIEAARDEILKEDFAQKLMNLISSKKLVPLSVFLESNLSFNKIYQYNTALFDKGYNYLKSRRNKKYGSNNSYYSTLDIYHYVLIDNIDKILDSDEIEFYLSSSGALSRNSWMLTKYGKFQNDEEEIPEDWAARSSDVPSFLVTALNEYNWNFKYTREYFEEIRHYSLALLKKLNEVEEIRNQAVYITRKLLKAQNPIVKVSVTIPSLIVILDELIRTIEPNAQSSLTTEKNGNINLTTLYKFAEESEDDSKPSIELREKIVKQIEILEINEYNWDAFIAPLGEKAYNILSYYGIDIDN